MCQAPEIAYWLTSLPTYEPDKKIMNPTKRLFRITEDEYEVK